MKGKEGLLGFFVFIIAELIAKSTVERAKTVWKFAR